MARRADRSDLADRADVLTRLLTRLPLALRRAVPRTRRRRRLAALGAIALGLAPASWPNPAPAELSGPGRLRFVAVATAAVDKRALGPFKLDRAWQIVARPRSYSGFSGLVALGQGRLFAATDRGGTLTFSAPDAPRREPPVGGDAFQGQVSIHFSDVEAATTDPETGQMWLATEGVSAIQRFDFRGGRLVDGKGQFSAAMAGWRGNSGPEAMVRLADGRFLVLREAALGYGEGSRHEALLFLGDPVERQGAVQRFTMLGPDGYKPTDAALLPDGRVLVLMRKVTWPAPPRFAGLIALGDPAEIRKGGVWHLRRLAHWRSGFPSDNFEALAVEPGDSADPDAPLTVWMLSDDNRADFQKTMLWKLRLDPARLPNRKQKGAR
jgi:Esterase-like activity of phytase